MRRSRRSPHSEPGQSLVIVALSLVALIGMLALVMDGGFTYLQRRVAQNAADAGALAGAREWCMTRNADSAIAAAADYAVNRNGAQEATASIDSGEVIVTTQTTFQTAFAQVLGQPDVTVGANAGAGCFQPTSGTGVLPVGWSCRAGEAPISPGGPCNVEYNKTYIIMDSATSSADHCAPQGTLDCDIDNDGRNDILNGSGDRSWLDFSGQCGGGSCLPDWIQNGYPDPVDIHTWVPGQTGNITPVYNAAKTKEHQYVILPFFDLVCKGNPATTPGCVFHSGDPQDQYTPAGPCKAGEWCFHIIGFSYFYIECVSKTPGLNCPEKKLAVQAGLLSSNDRSIEGHFEPGGIIPGLTGKGDPADTYDMGLYTLYLTR